MEASQIPVLGYVVFATAWVAGLGLFGCLYVLTRRLRMTWRSGLLSRHLASEDVMEIAKLIFGVSAAPSGVEVAGLVWAVRGLWLAFVALVGGFVILVAGAS